jgi:hypothetical protein
VKLAIFAIMELVEREIYFPGYIAFGFLLSLGLLVLSKIWAPNFPNYLKDIIFSSQPLSATAYSDTSKVKRGRFILLINFMIVSICAMEMIRFEYKVNVSLVFILAPLMYLFYEFVILRFSHSIAGHYKGVKAQQIILLGIFQVLGVILFPLLVIWYLNPNYAEIIFQLIYILFGLFILYRFIRGFFIGLSKQISWYYLILYLCTAEIYPLILLYAVFIGF